MLGFCVPFLAVSVCFSGVAYLLESWPFTGNAVYGESVAETTTMPNGNQVPVSAQQTLPWWDLNTSGPHRTVPSRTPLLRESPSLNTARGTMTSSDIDVQVQVGFLTDVQQLQIEH